MLVAAETEKKGKIGVLIEDHFDQTEFHMFNDYFPKQGYEVEYITHLWGQDSLSFGGNPDDGDYNVAHVTVEKEVNDVSLDDYVGFICIGAYAMDRLRYQVNVKPGQKNNAPAVAFLRKAMAKEDLKLGTICHSLWLFCADKDLLAGRKVTCAHNIISDVENTGAEVIYDNDVTADLVVDGDLISGKHPGVTQEFMEKFIEEIEK
ncbi:ThiJ/PfpI domain-containing protein [Thalassoporum mexicanum PCC 7367]|uniref:DJ-1/PfpI family protein n=1 Tax=Thalassoporum mexicanum TaxID=3457544 RepID=UPI0002A00093|nr:DJ-1/PfpI family protein [Pseudanabaena sp. PCC 7367]AFY68594.1 ThiJ/PfpI domain-containing protein [Pseudanabaena sp. PCC 7367]